jgi:hypothetical protein
MLFFGTVNEKIYFEIERSKKSKKEIEIMFMNLLRLIERDITHRVEIHFLRNFMKSYLDVYNKWLSDGTCQIYSDRGDGNVSELMTLALSSSMRAAMSSISFIEAF